MIRNGSPASAWWPAGRRDQEKQWHGLVTKANDHLKAAGLTSVHSKFLPGHFDVAEDIVKEAVAMEAGTIVMGRRGLGTAQSLILGSITNKVIQNPQGRAVIVVE